MLIRAVFTTIIICLLSINVLGQKGDSLPRAVVMGNVWDSTNLQLLKNATITICKSSDSSIIAFQLSDLSGGFRFNNIPAEVPLMLIVSYVGYSSVYRKVLIPDSITKFNLGRIDVFVKTDYLDEVVVSSFIPVRMRGDTLEFNPAAFKLKENAVVDDLLRVMPGFTIWGDGTITLNGREISRVMVDGRPFLGGDSKVAIQNIPGSVVDKIQVYQNGAEQKDSITELNIKLKKSAKKGFLGKLGLGIGTRDYFEEDMNFNIYSPKTQFSIGGIFNNINKPALSLENIIKNSTFKQLGESLENQSDFNLHGNSNSRFLGANIDHDFKRTGVNRYKKMSGRILVDDIRKKGETDVFTNTTIDESGNFVTINNSNSESHSSRKEIGLDYVEKKNRSSLNTGINWAIQSDMNSRVISDSLRYLETLKQSFEFSKSEEVEKVNSFNAKVNYKLNKKPFSYRKLAADWELNFETKLIGKSISGERISDFKAPDYLASGVRYYRDNNNKEGNFDNLLVVSISSITPFGSSNNFLKNIQFKVRNLLNANNYNQNSNVLDYDSTLKQFIINGYLTGKTSRNIINNISLLDIRWARQQIFAGRFERTSTLNVGLQEQIYRLNNSSFNFVQNLEYSNNKFIPYLNYKYENRYINRFKKTLSLEYATGAEYPAVGQIAPLVDSSVQTVRAGANANLKASYTHNIRTSYEYYSLRSKNAFNFSVGLTYSFVENQFSDSIVIDELGKITRYVINVDGYRSMGSNITGRKAFKFNGSELQLKIINDLVFIKNKSFLNGNVNLIDAVNERVRLSINFSIKDYFKLDIGDNFLFTKNKITQGNSTFSNAYVSNENFISGDLKILRRVRLSSVYTNTINKAVGSSGIFYGIWNVNFYMRFLKGENLEARCSFIDILRQNSNISIYNFGNSITTTRTNVLQNHIMFSISYYPRKFGSKNSN